MQAANQCPNCGAAVRLGAKFCGGCGAQLSTPVWTQPQQTVPIQQYSSAVEYQRGGSQTIAGTRVSISWTGSGGDLFWKLLGWMLLSLITLGIYYPWTICNLMKYMVERTVVQTS
jgi:hypothetical protein